MPPRILSLQEPGALLRRGTWAKAHDDDLRQRNVPCARVIRALSDKWAKIVWAVLSTRRPYDDTLHLAHRQRNGVAWAKGVISQQDQVA